MADGHPLVSIILASYNEKPEIITQSIKSILAQTYTNFEFLIFDDSSKKKTQEAIDALASDKRIKVFRSDKRIGFVESLNCGLELAKGEYIARMDGDDISLPTRLEKEVDFLQNHRDISVVGGQIDIIDEKGNVISNRIYPTGGIKMRIFCCFRSPLAHPTVMIRREVVDKGYRYDEKLKKSEDLDLWLRLLNDGFRLANINEKVLRYRVQADFAEKRTDKKQLSCMAYVRKKNFNKKHLLHSILSVTAGWILLHIPAESIKLIYNKENKRRIPVSSRKAKV